MTTFEIRSDMFLADFGKVSVTLHERSISWEWRAKENEETSEISDSWASCIQVISAPYHRVPERTSYGSVSLDDVYAIEPMGFGHVPGITSDQMHVFAVLTFSRAPESTWLPKKLIFGTPDLDSCHQWMRSLEQKLSEDRARPRSLLVFINPHGGKKQGAERWASVKPLFEAAKVQTRVVLTERKGHAFDILDQSSDSDLAALDGIVVVGGDGMFNEVLNGLLLRRTGPSGSAVSSSVIAREGRVRLGLIPAGSTDTVLISVSGSRDPVTAALHIILGDRLALDIVKLTNWAETRGEEAESKVPEVRFAASFCGYGFFGDVAKESERLRWMGPSRYDFAGFLTYLKHRSYEAEVSYVERPSEEYSPPKKRGEPPSICKVQCTECSVPLETTSCSEASPTQALDNTRTIHGRFHSVGGAVMSCRNERAPDGLVAGAHLSDGFMHLIMIQECSRANYLWQLIKLSQKGGDPFGFPFVRHHKTTAFEFKSVGAESIWSVDGELFPSHKLNASICPRLVHVFARRPEH